MAESGFEGIGTPHWQGLFAPGGTAAEIVELLHRTAAQALRSPEVRAAFEPVDVRVTPSASPAAFAADIRAEQARWRAVKGELGLGRTEIDWPTAATGAGRRRSARDERGDNMATHGERAPEAGRTKTEGAIKGGDGRYVFDLARLVGLDAGPGYSTAHGPVVEGERIQVGLMRMPRGTGRPAAQPSERAVGVRDPGHARERGGRREVARARRVADVHPRQRRALGAGHPRGDVLFLTAKDMSHGIVGTPVDQSISAPLYAPGFGPGSEGGPR